jgi:hypothetical protein
MSRENVEVVRRLFAEFGATARTSSKPPAPGSSHPDAEHLGARKATQNLGLEF